MDPASRTRMDARLAVPAWAERRRERQATPGQPERRYRVVYRHGERDRSLGRSDAVTASGATLDPFLSRLLLAGIRHGDLLLVDATTGRIVTRRTVRLPSRRS